MSKHINELQQKFADAAIELLMEEYAQADGNSLLAGYYRQEACTGIPAPLDHRCQKLISKNYQHMLIASTLKRAARAVACFFLMLLLTVPMAMSVEAFRIPVLNFILKEGKEFTEVSFSQNNSSFTALDYLRELIWEAIPEGFQLSLENIRTDKFMGSETVTSIFVRFQNSQDHVFAVSVTKAEGAMSIDSEDAEVISMDLYGQQTVVVAKAGELRAIWVNEDQGQLYDVTGYHTGPDLFWECVHKLAKSTMNPQQNISF